MISEMVMVEGATCYKVLVNVKCSDDQDSSCSAPCKKHCGPSAGSQCIDQIEFGFISACSFTAPDCQKQRICS